MSSQDRVVNVVRFVFVLLMLAPRPAAGSSIWEVQTIFTNISPSTPPSLALDENGWPRIAFNDWNSKNLTYAAWNGQTWSYETVAQTGINGGYPSLQVDHAGNPEISYYDDGTKRVMIATRESGNWNTEVVDNVNTWGTSLAIDSHGVAHIAYQDNQWNQGPSTVRYATRGSQGWTVENVDSGFQSGYYPVLALGSSDTPEIVYHQSVFSDSKFIAKGGASGWQVLPIETYANLRPSNSLAVDPLGDTYVTIIDSQFFDLYCLQEVNDRFQWQLVQKGNVGADSSIAIDKLGRPHIAYESGYDLVYASWDGSTWNKQVVDSAPYGGKVSLLLDGGDNPQLVYYDGSRSIKYASLVPEPETGTLVAACCIGLVVHYLARRKQA